MPQHIYLLHDLGGLPTGTVLALELLLQRKFASELVFHRPLLAHTNPEVAPETADMFLSSVLQDAPTGSLVVGLGVSGFLAARFLEKEPGKNLSVLALASPTQYGNLSLRPVLHTGLVALYSSKDRFLKGASDWDQYTPLAFDVLWLQDHRIDRWKYSISRSVERMLEGVPFGEVLQTVMRRGRTVPL